MNQKILKVVHIRDSSGMYGAERIILAILSSINTKKFSPFMICMADNTGKIPELVNETRKLGVQSETVTVCGRLDIMAVFKLRKMLQKTKTDIIHCHDFKSNFYGFLATVGTSVTRVTTAHGSTLFGMLKYYNLLDTYCILRFFNRIITVSSELTKYYINRGFNKSKIVEILNGLDITRLQKIQDYQSPSFLEKVKVHPVVIGTLSRLFPEKGLNILIESFAELKKEFQDMCLVIAGDGPQMTELVRLTESLGVKNDVYFLGVVTDVGSLYKALDVFVLPSFREGLPNVILEAMYFETPIVSTDVGCIPLLIENGKTGILTKPNNTAALTHSIRTSLKNQKSSKTMAYNARIRLENEYTAEIMVRKVEHTYLQG
jgi:glycosyltransferase involved in cell wall biosynthesis